MKLPWLWPAPEALALWRAMAALRANTDATAISAMVNALRASEFQRFGGWFFVGYYNV